MFVATHQSRAPTAPELAAGAALEPATFAEVRRRTIFDCCKWDPQVEDAAVLASYPLLVQPATWRQLTAWAELLAAEALAAEAELCARRDMMRLLGLPWGVRRLLARGPSPGTARVMRFDFHLTSDGWRISEANTDVPGGFPEASGFARLVAAHYPGRPPVGDPAGALTAELMRGRQPGAAIGFVHATAYTDDRQVMVYLGQRLAEHQGRALLLSPADLVWQDGRASLVDGTQLDAVVRFFPGEWLPNLPRRARWAHFFTGAVTPLANPASALVTQSKRFPLTWDTLATPLPTWRTLLPETRNPAQVPWRSEDWVMKPVFGRIGEGIGLRGVTQPKDWDAIARSARKHPTAWAAQRRFAIQPLATPEGPRYACVGVYTVGGVAAGAYGRISATPLIDSKARDIAVLLDAPAAPTA